LPTGHYLSNLKKEVICKAFQIRQKEEPKHFGPMMVNEASVMQQYESHQKSNQPSNNQLHPFDDKSLLDSSINTVSMSLNIQEESS